MTFAYFTKETSIQMKELILKFKTSPVGFVKTVLYKLIMGPVIYGQGDDYDAGRYWRDRLSKYGKSIRGVGDESLSENDNHKAYAEAAKIFIDYLLKQNVDFNTARVLEIGCGTGFYTQILFDLGVKNYLGVDITDVLFPQLQQKFTDFKFIKKDITTDNISGEFDLVVMIDVIQHIVKESKFQSAMNQVKSHLSNNGVFLIAPLLKIKKRVMFYLSDWTIDNLKYCFQNDQVSEPVLFRTGYLIAVRK
ncbi:MAG: class I SAM-dependent methyltransferase [Desmonostoc vinosum HA7617-LM4]|jgi:SAM-dependent methyltransferase|nr:class I SAM-dependent methyltransferase [Desmonostoc vinosum HA7617-LM4]